MLVVDSFALKDFTRVWDSLIDCPDVIAADFRNVDLGNALKISRAKVALIGTDMRGVRFAGQWESEYIIVQGEYGHLIMRTDPDNGVYLEKSASYQFDLSMDNVERKMDALVSTALLAGEQIPVLIQWYDSVYRRISGRRTSPNFDPVKSADKSYAAIAPGLEAMWNIRHETNSQSTPHPVSDGTHPQTFQ